MSPALLHHELPLTEDLHDMVLESRRQVEDVLRGRDPRLLVVVGPCSVHDPE
ncbi:MAG TPA: 3-deoxy-7-phosphoheptulonate synthase, partial [Actinoplanes sp.]|nr:3-deoxy-7-phosphoheptulonate synthase [Actinoplanes sp.]